MTLANMDTKRRRKIRRKLWVKYEGRCQLCLEEVLDDDFAVCRRVPSAGNVQSNLFIAHVECANKRNAIKQGGAPKRMRFDS